MFDEIIEVVKSYADWRIVAIVIASGYFQKQYLPEPKLLSRAALTLIVSFVATTLFLLADGSLFDKKSFPSYIMSYFISTSLYDIIVKSFNKWLGKP